MKTPFRSFAHLARLAPMITLLLAGVSAITESKAQTPLFGNLPAPSDDPSNYSSALDASRQKGMVFQTGGSPVTVDRIVLRLSNYSTVAGDVPVVQLRADVGSLASYGAQVGANFGGSPSSTNAIQNIAFTNSGVTLAANTKYWLLVYSSTGDFDWRAANTPGVTPTGTAATHFAALFTSAGNGGFSGSAILNSFALYFIGSQPPGPVLSSFASVITGNGAPNAAGADSGADFDALQRSGYLAQNGNLAFLGYLKNGVGGVDNTNFMGYWKHDGTSLKLLARQGDNAPETGATAAKFNILPLIPGISEGGQVTLFASLLQSGLTTPATTADNDVGLWSELGGTGFQILIREDDTIPGLGGPKVDSLGWGCFATATTSATTGEAAFVVGMKGTSTDTALLRTSVVNSSTTAVGVIARENTAAPGAGENFGGLNNSVTRSVRMDATGNVVFAAGLPSYKTGIWYQDQATKTVSKSSLTGEAAPGTTGATFQQLDLPNMGGGGTFAFRGVLNTVGDNAANDKNDGIWKATGTGAPALILRRGDSNTNRAGLFSATYTGTYASIKAGNIYNGWLTNANHGAWLGWVDLGGDGISAFPYDGNFTATTDTFGIYTDTSGTMTLLIASGDAAPGIAGSKFFFIDHPVCGGTEQVAFIATVNGGGVTPGINDKGLWRTASNGGALSLALRTGDTMSVSINGTPTTKTILDLDLPGSGYADHLWETPVMDGTGRLLVFVTFTDGSTTQVLAP